MNTTTSTDGWAVISYHGYNNTPVARAAYRCAAGWVSAPGQTRAIIADSRVVSITPMRVAAEDEIIVKAPAVEAEPVRHLSVVS